MEREDTEKVIGFVNSAFEQHNQYFWAFVLSEENNREFEEGDYIILVSVSNNKLIETCKKLFLPNNEVRYGFRVEIRGKVYPAQQEFKNYKIAIIAENVEPLDFTLL